MKRHWMVVAGLMLAATTVGCEGFGTYDGVAGADRTKREAAKIGAPAIAYQEVPYEGRIYVVSTAKAAADAAKGVHPPTAVTKIGMGPKRETVVFEADKFFVEDALMAEYMKRHPKK